MRVPAAAIVLVLAAGAGQTMAASSTPAPAPQVSPEEKTAGCMHIDLRRCMITLGSALWFDMNKVAPEIALRNEPDVNGNTAHRRIGITAGAPGHIEHFGIILTLASPAPNDTVVKAEVWLPSDPEVAHTQSEYDKTFLYDAVTPLLGNRCPGLERMALYRFYENELKPRETSQTEVQTHGIFHHTVKTNDTGQIPFCGALFTLHRRAEWDGTPDFPSPRTTSLAVYLVLE
jgi:hypothetical protein